MFFNKKKNENSSNEEKRIVLRREFNIVKDAFKDVFKRIIIVNEKLKNLPLSNSDIVKLEQMLYDDICKYAQLKERYEEKRKEYNTFCEQHGFSIIESDIYDIMYSILSRNE